MYQNQQIQQMQQAEQIEKMIRLEKKVSELEDEINNPDFGDILKSGLRALVYMLGFLCFLVGFIQITLVMLGMTILPAYLGDLILMLK